VNGAPANGTYDFLFRIHNAATSATQQGLEIGSLNDGTRQFDGLSDDVRICNLEIGVPIFLEG